jgi:hypothetical protein
MQYNTASIAIIIITTNTDTLMYIVILNYFSNICQ